MSRKSSELPAFVCIGGAVVDRKYLIPVAHAPGSSNPAATRVSYGGVARNVAENLARLGADVALAAAVGADAAGIALRQNLVGAGVKDDLLHVMTDAPTAEYAAMLDPGGLILGAAVMDGAEQGLEAALPAVLARLPQGCWLFADANLTEAAMADLAGFARAHRRFLAVDAVSVAKSRRLPATLEGISLVVMNCDEASAVLGRSAGAAVLAAGLVMRGAEAAVVTAGAAGAAGASADGVEMCPAVSCEVRDVTGAGDSLIACLLWRLGLGDPLAEALRWGVHGAALTLETTETVHPLLTADYLGARLSRMGFA